jgi:hypothetical protein
MLKQLKNITANSLKNKIKETFLSAKFRRDHSQVEIKKQNQETLERKKYIYGLYKFLMKREPSEQEIDEYHVTSLNYLELFHEFINSEELLRQQEQRLTERLQYIEYLYRFLLKREPSTEEISNYHSTNLSYVELFSEFIVSLEFSDKNQVENYEREEYMKYIYRFLLKREPLEKELEYWSDNQQSYLELFKGFVTSEEYHSLESRNALNLEDYLGCSNYIVGESEPMYASTILEWYRQSAIQLVEKSNKSIYFSINNNSPNLSKNCNISSKKENGYLVTIIASMYKGQRYIKTFLENMVQQTIFERCQLFIVDANSPENEYDIIKDYLEYFPNNITYHRSDTTIGIYAAWNFAIQNSHSTFLTNANLDDCHRLDALEKKVNALHQNPEIDIVYSDVYYSFIENLPFEIIEKCGVCTNLPTANKFNLLKFNSPHNSPMWRRSLHKKIGLFDPTYKSAGDMELWLRAAFSNCQFMKIDEPVVGYYHNPNGLSTRPDSLGCIEGEKVINIYKALLTEKLE